MLRRAPKVLLGIDTVCSPIRIVERKERPRERDARYFTLIQVISKFSISNIVAHGDAQRRASDLVEKRHRNRLLMVCQVLE